LAENINFFLKQKWITNYCNFVHGGKKQKFGSSVVEKTKMDRISGKHS